MTRQYAHGRTLDGRDYTCEQCGAIIPDGVFLEGRWTTSGKLTGVRAVTPDGELVHECGAPVVKGEGQHG